jgi:hypothetical protein
MSWLNDKITAMSQGARLTTGATLLAIGIAGGASAASLTRPGIEMAPTVVTPIARLAASSGIVTIKGRIAEIYGDRALVADASGKTMVDIGRGRASSLAVGSTVLVQGRFDDGQVRGSFLVGPGGAVEAIGPRPHDGPGRRDPRAERPGPEAAAGPADCAPPPPPPAPQR